MQGEINNVESQLIILTVSSIHGDGSYSLLFRKKEYMNPNPLAFYPNADFHGLDELLFSNKTCKLINKIEDPNWMSHKSKKRSEHNLSFFSESDTKFYKRKREISYYADNEKLQNR